MINFKEMLMDTLRHWFMNCFKKFFKGKEKKKNN